MDEKELIYTPENQNEEIVSIPLNSDVSECNYDIIIPPFELNTDSISDAQFDEKEFKKGIKDISFICGQITGLINCGISPIEALGFVVNRETIQHNLDSAKISKEMNIEVAKHQSIQLDKTQL